LALNALWALKNLLFHAGEPIKSQVMTILGWDTLKACVDATSCLLSSFFLSRYRRGAQ
jgi:hypothetical protein